MARGPQRGQALVEFAFVLPVFLLLLAGLADFGVGLFTQMTLANATREGARAATVDPDPTTYQQVALASAEAAAGGLTAANLSVTATCVQIIPTTPKPCSFSPNTSQRGDGVSITATYPYNWIWPIHIHVPVLNVDLFANSITLSSTVQMIRQ